MESGESTETRIERLCRRLGLTLTGPAVLVLSVAGIYAIGDAVFAPAPAPEQPGFVDTVLGSRAVVAAIRLAVIFAAAFVVASVMALIARGQWLTRVGPVQVAEPASTLRADEQRLEAVLGDAGETLGNIREDQLEFDHPLEPRVRDEEEIE